ncbi:MAG: hypothetical protein ACP5D1_06250 [Bacteroidales bacterium]
MTNQTCGAGNTTNTIQEEDSIKILKEMVFSSELSLLRLELVAPSSGVQFYRDGIIYLYDTKTGQKNMEIPFGSIDTYYAAFEGKTMGEPELFSNLYAFPFPSESVSFTEDEKTMFFSRETETRSTGKIVEKIYQTEYITSHKKRKSGWSKNITELPFNGDEYSCTQPSVSADGNIMVFSSDMPGGRGGYDLYIVVKTSEGWEKPVNMGNAVNTADNENHPFLLNPETLFFSSNGHPGFGGYDIFITKFDRKKWTEPVNLGEGINSPDNEFAFVMDRDNPSRAFFSSTRFQPRQVLKLFDATLIAGKDYLAGQLPADSLVFTYEEPSTSASTLALSAPSQTSENITVTEKEIDKNKNSSETTLQEEQTTSIDTLTAGKSKVTESVVPPPEPAKIPEQASKAEAPDEPAEPKTEETIDFRVQITASTKSLGTFTVSIEGIIYETSEYFYSGAYRYTIGKFSRVGPAIELQKKCRSAGYPQAFVAAFKNNVRTLDKEVFQKYR